MKRKISFVIVCMFAVITLFSGCSLITVNQGKYLNQVVATCGEIEITKEQVITAYNNYYSTLSEQNMSQNQMIDYCINLLIDREILTNKAKADVELTQTEKNTALTKTYDFMISQIAEIESEVRSELDIDITTSTESVTAPTLYNEYSPKANFVDGEIVIVNETNATEVAHYGFTDKVAGFKTYWVYEQQEVADIALERYIKDLRDYEEYKNIKTDTDNEVLLNEINRLFKLYEKEAYLNKLQTSYNDSLIAEITAEQVLNEYNRLVNKSKGSYDVTEIGFDSYVDDMLNNAKDVYYHPVNNEFFYVSHILLKYSDEQTALINEKKELLNQKGMTQESYDEFIKTIAAQIEVEVLDSNGNPTGETLTAEEAYANVSASVSNGATLTEKARNFNEYIYTYNQDPGIKNAVKDYVIGKKIDEETESRSKMVVPFTDASRDLYNAYLEDNVLGNISGLVLSEHGYHIIMLTGVAENMIVSENAIEGCEDLTNYLVNAHTTQNYFQLVFDSIYEDNRDYNAYTTAIITDYKAEHVPHLYSSRLADMRE